MNTLDHIREMRRERFRLNRRHCRNREITSETCACSFCYRDRAALDALEIAVRILETNTEMVGHSDKIILLCQIEAAKEASRQALAAINERLKRKS